MCVVLIVLSLHGIPLWSRRRRCGSPAPTLLVLGRHVGCKQFKIEMQPCDYTLVLVKRGHRRRAPSAIAGGLSLARRAVKTPELHFHPRSSSGQTRNFTPLNEGVAFWTARDEKWICRCMPPIYAHWCVVLASRSLCGKTDALSQHGWYINIRTDRAYWLIINLFGPCVWFATACT